MEFRITTTTPETQDADCIVAPVFERRTLSETAERLDRAGDGFIRSVVEGGDFNGEGESVHMLHRMPGVAAARVLLLGCGKRDAFDLKVLRKVSAAASRTLERGSTRHVAFDIGGFGPSADDLAARARALVESVLVARYRFDQFKSEAGAPETPLERITLCIPESADTTPVEHAIAAAQAIANGIALARDLANRPGNICTPAHLADEARDLAEYWPKLETRVLEADDMEKLGMGALLAVSRGSRQPPKLIAMEYMGGGDTERPVVFVGKGVTFDTGGISIKPAQGMDEMKFDMGGAASVFGVMRAVAELELPINVIGVVPAVENMPDGAAVKPGDILTTMSGRTVEVLNTDAEGRLILCDALTWVGHYKPEAVIDIATLTGACIVALGHHPAALLTNDDTIAGQLLAAGENSGDRCWRLPLWDDYQEQLKSPFADMANIGGQPAGTITAACFLSRFTEEYEHWAHLDIAGVAWTRGDKKGATGRPVALLMQYLLERNA